MFKYQEREQQHPWGKKNKQIPLRSFTPVSLVTQKPKPWWGKVSNLVFPMKIYYPMTMGKRWGEERRRVERNEGRRKERRRKRRKEGRATLPLVKNRKISRFLDTPCGQKV